MRSWTRGRGHRVVEMKHRVNMINWAGTQILQRQHQFDVSRIIDLTLDGDLQRLCLGMTSRYNPSQNNKHHYSGKK
ncbi:MAG TPA: hypothetical protein EYQ03_03080 [Nitrospinaceae bacterium]|nr:hypothetical protein [Nitrospinaceae bacterium]